MTSVRPVLETSDGSDDAGPILVRSIQPSNILSFGPDTEPIELRSLNVLIGPNGSGKSNLIDVIAALRACPTDIRKPIRESGGVTEWIWKGAPDVPAGVEAVVSNPDGVRPLRHAVQFSALDAVFHLADEIIENDKPDAWHEKPIFHYKYQQGNPVLRIRELDSINSVERRLKREEVELDQSILAQRKDTITYPELTYLGSAYSSIRIYREWQFGRNSVLRHPQSADARNDQLEEDFSNLGLFLNRLKRTPSTKKSLIAALRDLYSGIDDFDVSIEGSTVQVFFTEGDFPIPSTRLSDGTLRYLCLLSILLDRSPSGLICIEEPELGLHPDVLPRLAGHLLDASSRMQLIVTTHSEVLVDALTDHAESVLVCEKHEGATRMRRLTSEQLAPWLDSYRLGQLWSNGELGGNRW